MLTCDYLLGYVKVETYEDKDGAREDEIAALGGHTATGINVYSAFYDRLKEVFLLSILLQVLLCSFISQIMQLINFFYKLVDTWVS